MLSTVVLSNENQTCRGWEAHTSTGGGGCHSEYDCIERVAKDYQDRCKEPTVTITWSECNDFEDGEVIPLAEANKRFEFTR